MITYKNSYAVGNKFYADIIALENDKIFVDDLANGSSLRLIDASDSADSNVLYYFDQENGMFRNGTVSINAYLTVLPATTFTFKDSGGTNRQRFADVRNFAEGTTYYVELKSATGTSTIPGTGKKDESGNMVFTLQNIGQIVANVAESEAYGEPGLYIVSPLWDQMVGAELSISIYVNAFGLMDKYGH